MKTCVNKNCHQINPQSYDNFNKNKRSYDGYLARCRVCVSRQTRISRSKPEIREQRKTYNHAYRKRPGRRERIRVSAIKWRENPENKRKLKDSKLRKLFGISLLEFELMLSQQKHVCALCFKPETAKHGNGKIKELAVDHCHSTLKVRGLLCSNCNRGLGYLKDDSEILKRAVEYLSKTYD